MIYADSGLANNVTNGKWGASTEREKCVNASPIQWTKENMFFVCGKLHFTHSYNKVSSVVMMTRMINRFFVNIFFINVFSGQ